MAVTFAGQPLLGTMGPSLPLPVYGDPELGLYRVVGSERATTGRLLGPRVWLHGAKLALRGRLPRTPQGQDVRQLGGAAVVDATAHLVWRHVQRDPADYPTVAQIATAVRSAKESAR